MKKILMSLMLLAFTAGLSAPAFSMKHEADEKVAAACKGKKAGDKVSVDGKDVTCPEKKKKEKKGS